MTNEVLTFGHGVADDQNLKDFKDLDDDLLLARVECSLDWNNQLGNNRKNLLPSAGHHVVDTLFCKKGIGLLNLAQPVKKDGEVVVEIELRRNAKSCRGDRRDLYLLDVHLPSNSVGDSTVVNLDGEVPSFVESTELRVWWIRSFGECLIVHDFGLGLNSFRLFRRWSHIRTAGPGAFLQEFTWR